VKLYLNIKADDYTMVIMKIEYCCM